MTLPATSHNFTSLDAVPKEEIHYVRIEFGFRPRAPVLMPRVSEEHASADASDVEIAED